MYVKPRFYLAAVGEKWLRDKLLGSRLPLLDSLSLSQTHTPYVAVTGVPHFEIYLQDNPSIRQQFSGAQPIDTFVSIFNRLRMLAKV